MCKARKKGCDKALPTCGYCARKSLACKYEEISEESTLPFAAGSPELVPWSIDAILELTQPSKLDRALNLQVGRILQSAGLSLPQVSEQFFRAFHRWLPAVSPTLLGEIALDTQHGPPSADVSVLVLAMCLTVLGPRNEGETASIGPGTLYGFVKVVFAQVQGIVTTTMRLVQSGLILAAYEYACSRPTAAFITVSTVARMGQSLGMETDITLPIISQAKTPPSRLKLLERRNAWWCVVILER